MSTIRLSGTSSGYYDLTVPAAAGTNSIDLSDLPVKDSNGNLGIGTNSPANFGGQTIQVNHASSYSSVLASSGAYTMQLMASQANGVMNIGARSNHHVSITTNDTPRMTIDSSGRILTPSQPKFCAYVNSNVSFSSLADNQVVDFQAVNVNTGNHYSTTTHLFTAPIAGTYWFGVSMRVDNVGSTGGDYFHPYLGKNGTTGLEGSLNGRMIVTAETQNIFAMVTGTWLVQLAANDTIGVYHGDGNSAGVHAGSAYYQAGQCNFSGYLLG